MISPEQLRYEAGENPDCDRAVPIRAHRCPAWDEADRDRAGELGLTGRRLALRIGIIRGAFRGLVISAISIGIFVVAVMPASASRYATSELVSPGWAKGGTPSDPASQVAADEKYARSECAENTLLLFRVRGSGEQAGSDNLGTWTFAAGKAAIAKGWRVRDMQADYPTPSLQLWQLGVDVAVAVVRKKPLALASAVKRLKDFRDVASRSWEAVRDQLVAAYERCTKRRILVAGYSYGGLVLRYVVRNLRPEVRERIVRIDLVADPTAQGSIDREMNHSGGLDARSTPQGIDTWAARKTNPFFKQSRYPENVVRRTAQYCVPYDLVCEANPVNFAAFAGQSKRHTSYKWAAIGRQATERLRSWRSAPMVVFIIDNTPYARLAAWKTWIREYVDRKYPSVNVVASIGTCGTLSPSGTTVSCKLKIWNARAGEGDFCDQFTILASIIKPVGVYELNPEAHEISRGTRFPCVKSSVTRTLGFGYSLHSGSGRRGDEGAGQRVFRSVLARLVSRGSMIIVIRGDRAIGGFRFPGGTLESAIREFGAPSARRPSEGLTISGRAYYCSVTWKQGLRLRFWSASESNCAAGSTSYEAVVTGGHFRTDKGLRIGESVSRLRRLYPRAAFLSKVSHEGLLWGPHLGTGFALVTRKPRWCDAVPVPQPTLFARVRAGRVTTFVMSSIACE